MMPNTYTPGTPSKVHETQPSKYQALDLTQDQISQIAGTLTRTRPAYGPIMDFYSRVFGAQAETRAAICPDPIIIEDDLLALKRENDMPLITPSQFKIDIKAAKKLMRAICQLAVDHAPKLAQAGENLALCLDKTGAAESNLDLDHLFFDLLDGKDIQKTADSCKISTEALGFFGFSAMLPSIQACATQLDAYLKEKEQTDKGYCPICGSLPDLSILDDSGKKLVSCSLCSHIWPVKRMTCIFCDATGADTQHYFYSGEEPEYRVYCCDDCGHYLKTVDTRQLGRRFFPKLEQIATLHLDIKAKERGYRPPETSGSLAP